MRRQGFGRRPFPGGRLGHMVNEEDPAVTVLPRLDIWVTYKQKHGIIKYWILNTTINIHDIKIDKMQQHNNLS